MFYSAIYLGMRCCSPSRNPTLYILLDFLFVVALAEGARRRRKQGALLPGLGDGHESGRGGHSHRCGLRPDGDQGGAQAHSGRGGDGGGLSEASEQHAAHEQTRR
jgi:hypothetical protein